MRFALHVASCAVSVGVLSSISVANSVFITEFCSDTGNNEKYEYAEITNTGSTPVSMSGWSEDDSHGVAGTHSLTLLGTLQPGQSGITTEASPAAFRAYWGLPSTALVVGGYTNHNLDTASDSVTLFNNNNQLVDRLDYSTTNGGSADAGNPPYATRNAPLIALGMNANVLWQNSYVGDVYGSYQVHSAAGSKPIGNPDQYTPVPEPTVLLQAGVGLALLGLTSRLRFARATPTA